MEKSDMKQESDDSHALVLGICMFFLFVLYLYELSNMKTINFNSSILAEIQERTSNITDFYESAKVSLNNMKANPSNKKLLENSKAFNNSINDLFDEYDKYKHRLDADESGQNNTTIGITS